MPPKPSRSETKALALDDLKRSGLDLKDARKLKFEILLPHEVAGLCGAHTHLGRSGYLVPYHDLKGNLIEEMYRLRFVGEPICRTLEEPRRYTQPSGVRPYAYFPPSVDWQKIISNPNALIVFTEGEKKAAALCKQGIPCVGLGGVWNFRSSAWLMTLLPEIVALGLRERLIYVAYDSDIRTKEGVRLALGRFCDELIDQGATIYDVAIPDLGDGKTGLDDFLLARGKKAFEKLMLDAEVYDAAETLWEFNERFAVISDPGLVIEPATGRRFGVNQFTTISFSHIHVERPHAHTGKLVKRKAAQVWLEWPQRRSYGQMVYEPGRAQDIDGNFNLWRGWACEPVAGACDEWLDYVSYLVDDDEEAFTYLLRWLAYALQNPGAKLATAIFIWSHAEGTGKSFLGECMELIYGANYKAIGPADYERDFNAWAVNRQFIMIDEAKGGDRRADAEILKRLITREEIEVNQKYQGQFWIRDTINYYITSNHPDALYLSTQDRRIWVWNKRGAQRPPEYFARLKKKLIGGMAAAVFDYLLNLDLGDFDPAGRAPETQSKVDVIEISKSDLESWVDMLRLDPEIALADAPCDLIEPTELVRRYAEAHDGAKLSAGGLGRALKKRGFEQRVVRIGRMTKRMWALRNPSKWTKASPKEWGDHYKENVLKGGPKEKM